jgi:MFS family permease
MGAVTQLPAGRISDRMDRRFVLATASGLCALVSLAIFLIKPVDSTMIMVATGLYGGLAYTLYSIASAHANDHAKDGNFIAISGGMLLLYGVGTMVGPLVASALMQQFGGAAIFLATFIFQGLVVATVLWRISVRAAPITKSIFRWTPWERSMTPQTIQLDPRSAE